MSLEELRKLVLQKPLLVAAGTLLLIATILAVFDRVAAGSLVAGLFVVCLLFHYLPELESFKAYGVEAKLRAKLGEADDILRKLRQSTLASAKLTYSLLGWGSRMSGQRPKEKREITDLVDAALLDLGVPPSDVVAMKKDYLFFTAYDIFQGFDGVVQLTVNKYMKPLLDGMMKLHQDESNPEWQELSKRRAALEESRRGMNLLNELSTTRFRELAHARIPPTELSKTDRDALMSFADELSYLVEESERTGRLSDAALEISEAHSPDKHAVLYRKIFKEEPVM